ncbi:hypothetical protein [Rhodococcoides fascians]|uniref:hypothetical protein n=1 Tax=Rhodococcoides fascians TaxID=1828 RepID=UPI00113FD60F|nr:MULTISPECIES: hypothetical protein [Rhodococcus]
MSAPLFSDGQPRRRLLRPRHIHVAAGYVWVIDETQPVAALLDPATGSLDRLVSWPELPAASRTLDISSDEGGLWLHYRGADALARVTPDGLRHAEYIGGAALLTSGSIGAWCFRPGRARRDVAQSPDTPPLRRSYTGPQLLLAKPDGGTVAVTLRGHLITADFDETSLHLGVEHEPWSRTHSEPDGYAVTWTQSWVDVPLDTVATSIDPADYPRRPLDGDWHTSEYADITYNESHRRKRAVGNGIRWHWGQDTSWKTMMVQAVRGDRVVHRRTFAGTRGVEGAATGEDLYLITSQRSLLHISTLSEPRTITSTEELDISEHCRPVAPWPPDHESYVAYCIRRLHGRQFSSRMHDVDVRFVGDWPDGNLQVSFTHDNYEGITLVSTLNLYDEEGKRLDDVTRYAPVELMEQADTLAYPDPSLAVDGVLYV